MDSWSIKTSTVTENINWPFGTRNIINLSRLLDALALRYYIIADFLLSFITIVEKSCTVVLLMNAGFMAIFRSLGRV